MGNFLKRTIKDRIMINISMHFWTHHHYPIYIELARNIRKRAENDLGAAINLRMRTNYPHFNVEIL